jgi:hypothetical protein
MGWRMWPCFPRRLRDALWPIDTTVAMSMVEGAFVQRLLLLGGVSILFRTLTLSLVRLAPIPLARVDDGKWRYTYPDLLPSFGC